MPTRPASVAAIALVTLANPVALAGGDPPTFTDATDTRLVADAAIGDADTTERDYAVVDLDQDGDDDLVVGRRRGLNNNGGEARANVLLMNEDGVLTDRTAEFAPLLLGPERTRDVITADLNADGWPDVIVGDGQSFETMKILLNRGEDAGVWLGLEDATGGVAGIFTDTWTLAAGDLLVDGDAFPDLFVGTRNGNDRILQNLGVDEGGAWLGFADASDRLGGNATTSATRSSVAGDFDQDGDLDLLQGVTFPTGASRILWNEAGQFTGTPLTVSTSSTYNVASDDMDGDGDLDFVSVRNGTDIVRFNQTTKPAPNTVDLGPSLTLSGSNGFGSIARIVDLDGDGAMDILICDLDQEFPQDCSRRLRIWLGSTPAGSFTDPWPGGADWLPNGTSDVAPMDIDGDGDLDLVIAHCGGTSVFLQDGGMTSVPGDVNGDGSVNLDDLLLMLASFGPCPGGGAPCPADADDSGNVDFGDLLILLGNWS
jgi:hypothetical protein